MVLGAPSKGKRVIRLFLYRTYLLAIATQLSSPQPTDIYPSVSPAEGEIPVLTRQGTECGMGYYDRRDVFKAVLVVSGANELPYDARSYHIDTPGLVFTNRLVPLAWGLVPGSGLQAGYTEPFLHLAMRGVSPKDSVLYRVDGNSV